MITHNAAIADMADRVISLADGLIAGVRENEVKSPARALAW
jgi:putative ABC transport system ATP-binding protein